MGNLSLKSDRSGDIPHQHQIMNGILWYNILDMITMLLQAF